MMNLRDVKRMQHIMMLFWRRASSADEGAGAEEDAGIGAIMVVMLPAAVMGSSF